MLTKVELSIVISVLDLPCKIWLLPFNWEETKFRLSVADSKRRNFVVFFLYFANIVYFFILVYQLRATFEKNDADDYLYHAIYLVSAAGTAVLKYNLWKYRLEVTQIVNNTIQYNFRLGTDYYFYDSSYN
jgi:hypothetical protein